MLPAGSVLDGINVIDPFPAQDSLVEVAPRVKPKMELEEKKSPKKTAIIIHFFIAQMNFFNG